ncbi:MAG: N-methyl-L-tryptophan oxidase [Chloroflexota bacterium]
MIHTDVAVIGLGAMGSMALWRLADRGASVVGFEQFEPGNDRGSSHGDSRIIRTAYFEGPQYVPLVRESFVLWRDLENSSGEQLLTMTGALMIGDPQSEVVAGTLTSVREYDLPHEILDSATMRTRYPQHRISADEIAVWEELGGFLRPERSVMAAIECARQKGARMRPHTRVDRLEVDGERVRIVAGDIEVEATHAIVAVGPWLGTFVPELELPLTVTRQVLAWFPVRDPEMYAPSRFPVFVHDTGAGRMRYGFPTLDRGTVKLAIHNHGHSTVPDNVNRLVDEDDMRDLQYFVENRLVGVEPIPARTAVCMYTNTPDAHFLIGQHARLPRITLLGGFSGHGFKFAPLIGDAAADLALLGETRYPIELFDPERFGTTKQATTLGTSTRGRNGQSVD